MDVGGKDMPWRGEKSRSRAAARGWAGLAGLIVLCVAVYLPGVWTIPVVDRDEARFAQASRQMAESGDWVVPRVGDTPRLNKPPLIYWMQGLSARVFTNGDMARDAIWMYRVPSVVAAVLVVLLAWRLGCAMFDPRVAWAAAALLAISPVMAWEARQARADMVMVAFTTASIWLLWETLRRRSLVCAAGLWIAVGFGVLTKGPAPLLVVCPAILAWCVLRGSWAGLRAVRPVLGLGVVGLIVLPWVALVAMRVGVPEYLGIVTRETLGRSVQGQEGHWGPPGYHAAVAVAMLFPASLWLVGGLVRATRVGLRWHAGAGAGAVGWWRRARGVVQSVRAGRAPECYLLCVALPAWLVFEVVGTKLPHYTMPLYPAVALLCVRAALSRSAWLRAWSENRRVRMLVRAWCVVPLGLGAACGAVGYIAAEAGAWWAWGVMGAAGAGVLVFVVEARRLVRAGDTTGLLWRSARLGGVCLALLGATLPHVPRLWVVSRLVEASREEDPDGKRALAFVRLHEDSARFLTRGRALWIGEHEVRGFVQTHPDALVVMPSEMAARWAGLHVLREVAGVNYSKGERGTWVLGEFAP